MNHDPLPINYEENNMHIIFAVFVNNRKYDIDEFKCVNRVRKGAPGHNRYCMDMSFCRLCYMDIVNCKPHQSILINYEFFSGAIYNIFYPIHMFNVYATIGDHVDAL
jgi:hypothetical protein